MRFAKRVQRTFPTRTFSACPISFVNAGVAEPTPKASMRVLRLARIFHEKCARRAETAALAFARAALRG
jgi:hypothetical protein